MVHQYSIYFVVKIGGLKALQKNTSVHIAINAHNLNIHTLLRIKNMGVGTINSRLRAFLFSHYC